MWPLAPEVNFFISAVPSVWNTFIRDVRSLQSHWSCMVFDHHALPWSPKCFTSVYIHKKIGDKRGRREGEKLSGEWDSNTGWWANVNLDETQSAILCSYMKIIHATKQTHFWVSTVRYWAGRCFYLILQQLLIGWSRMCIKYGKDDIDIVYKMKKHIDHIKPCNNICVYSEKIKFGQRWLSF